MVHTGTCKYTVENDRKVTKASSRRVCVLTLSMSRNLGLYTEGLKSPMLESSLKWQWEKLKGGGRDQKQIDT